MRGSITKRSKGEPARSLRMNWRWLERLLFSSSQHLQKLESIAKSGGMLLQLSFTCGYLVFTAMWLAKGAFVVYCYHLCPGLTSGLRKYLVFISGFTATTYVVTILIQTLWCRPIYTAW